MSRYRQQAYKAHLAVLDAAALIARNIRHMARLGDGLNQLDRAKISVAFLVDQEQGDLLGSMFHKVWGAFVDEEGMTKEDEPNSGAETNNAKREVTIDAGMEHIGTVVSIVQDEVRDLASILPVVEKVEAANSE